MRLACFGLKEGRRKSARRTSAENCGAFADIAEQRPNTAEMIFFMNRFHSLGDGSVTPQCGRSTPALRSDSDVAAFRVGLLGKRPVRGSGCYLDRRQVASLDRRIST